jgi:hypothetical protein
VESSKLGQLDGEAADATRTGGDQDGLACRNRGHSAPRADQGRVCVAAGRRTFLNAQLAVKRLERGEASAGQGGRISEAHVVGQPSHSVGRHNRVVR